MKGSRRVERGRRLGSKGFTLVELGVSMATTGVLLAMGYGAFRQYAEATIARKASVQLAADVSLTRSFAIQRRESVSLVADEANRIYVIRDTAGTVLMRRSFGVGSDLPLTNVVVSTAGDSLTFNSRGLLIPSSAQVVLGRRGRSHMVRINALGRTRID
jgi:Tfp pilus assembly protein FimT